MGVTMETGHRDVVELQIRVRDQSYLTFQHWSSPKERGGLCDCPPLTAGCPAHTLLAPCISSGSWIEFCPLERNRDTQDGCWTEQETLYSSHKGMFLVVEMDPTSLLSANLKRHTAENTIKLDKFKVALQRMQARAPPDVSRKKPKIVALDESGVVSLGIYNTSKDDKSALWWTPKGSWKSAQYAVRHRGCSVGCPTSRVWEAFHRHQDEWRIPIAEDIRKTKDDSALERDTRWCAA